MAIGPRLDLRQSQSLVMTPQLQQAIKLLALSNLEIEAFIAEELEKNPLIEAGASDENDGPAPEARRRPRDDFEAEPTDALSDLQARGDEAPLDVDYAAETFHHDSPSDMADSSGQGLDGSLGMAGDRHRRRRGRRLRRHADRQPVAHRSSAGAGRRRAVGPRTRHRAAI